MDGSSAVTSAIERQLVIRELYAASGGATPNSWKTKLWLELCSISVTDAGLVVWYLPVATSLAVALSTS